MGQELISIRLLIYQQKYRDKKRKACNSVNKVANISLFKLKQIMSDKYVT